MGDRNPQAERAFLFPHPEREVNMFSFIPDGLFYFAYHPYPDKAMLSRATGFPSTSNMSAPDTIIHTDCLAHNCAHYLLSQTLPHHPCVGELSVLIRQGKLTRDVAVRYLEEPVNLNASDSALVAAHLGVTRTELAAWARAAAPTRFVHFW